MNENDTLSDFYIDTLNLLDERHDLSIEEISNLVTKTQNLYSQVADSINLKLDAQLLAGLAQALENYIGNNPLIENQTKKYQPEKWNANLRCQYGLKETITDNSFWDDLGNIASKKCFTIVPNFKYIYGSVTYNKIIGNNNQSNLASTSQSNQPQTKLKTKANVDYKRDRDKAGQAPIKPNSMLQDASLSANTDSSMVNQNAVDAIFDQLIYAWKGNNCKPVSFWSLVLDKESFENTILNIFHASFLLKDGYLQVFYSAENVGHPLVCPIPKSLLKSRTPGIKDHIYTFLEITQEQWSCLKSVVEPLHKKLTSP